MSYAFQNRRKKRIQMRKCKLIILNDGEPNERFMLNSPSGANYAIGKTLKNSIYGKVVHAMMVEGSDDDPFNDQSELVHARKRTDVAIKIYSKSTCIF